MIKNDRQHALAKVRREEFRDALTHIEAHPEESAHLLPMLQKAERDALQSQMETLGRELAEYEALR